jgi:hypothetical protein
MLTNDEITNAFISKVGEPPEPVQLEVYRDFTLEDLHIVLDRRIAIENDPTYYQRLAENYLEFQYATPEQQRLWKFPDPVPQNK